MEVDKKDLLQTVYENHENLYEQVKAQLEVGADINTITSHGESPLRVASNNGRADVIKLLLENGADERQLAWSPSFFEVAFGTTKSLTDSIIYHQDINEKDRWDRTPWLFAVLLGDLGKVRKLIKLGADIEAVGRCGKTALMYAIQNNNLDILDALIELGMDIDGVDDYQYTPLIYAAERGMTECVRFLLEKGADISKQNHIPEKAIEVASNMEIVDMLLSRGESLDAITEKMRFQLLGLGERHELEISKFEYIQGRYRRFGKSNPEKSNFKYCYEMIKAGGSGYCASKQFDMKETEPVWCYERFGRTITKLEDGRFIEIAGEHEDSCDPDFLYL